MSVASRVKDREKKLVAIAAKLESNRIACEPYFNTSQAQYTRMEQQVIHATSGLVAYPEPVAEITGSDDDECRD